MGWLYGESEGDMSTYRPTNVDWHDNLGFDCTCDPAWKDRGLVDDRCWYHRCIDVLDEFEMGELLGDEPLFSRRLACDDRAWQCRQGSHDDYRCYEYTQVWPKAKARAT